MKKRIPEGELTNKLFFRLLPIQILLALMHKEGEIILRIKDDCKPFDPSERRKVFNAEDKAKNVGIRLVYGIAKQLEYRNMLGLNVLQIRI